MHDVTLPGIDGRVPLGFLAALGLLHLATTQAPQSEPTLSWNPADATPVLHNTQWSTVDDIAEWLIRLATNLPDNQLMPGLPPEFPPPGTAPDPLVPHRRYFPALLARYPQASDIICALVTDLCVNADGRVRRTPMVAPTGKQSFYTMYRNQRDYIRAEPSRLREALAGWRRVRGCVAEGFDHAAIIGGADDPAGKPGERGVPGATWLAIAGLPAYRLAADQRGRLAATGWRRIGGQFLLTWPLWEQALDLSTARVLLEHPDTTRVASFDNATLTVDATSWRPLTVFQMCAARRRPTGNADGPLVPITVTVNSPRSIPTTASHDATP